MAVGAEVQRWGELGKEFVVEMARCRAGGEEVTIRSMAQCGMAGTVAYGLLGESSTLQRKQTRYL